MGLFGRTKKAPDTKTIELQEPLLMKSYKGMLPEFSTFKKAESADFYKLASEYQTKAEALDTLLAITISKDTKEPLKSILTGINLGGIDHEKIKVAQQDIYKLATNAALQNVFEMLEGRYWVIRAYSTNQVIDRKSDHNNIYSMVVYDTINHEIQDALRYSIKSGDQNLRKMVEKLEFKALVIRGKDPEQDVKFVYQSAILAASKLGYKDDISGEWRYEISAYHSKKLTNLCDSKPEDLKESDKIKISNMCDRILDAAVIVNLLTQQERELIPEETSDSEE